MKQSELVQKVKNKVEEAVIDRYLLDVIVIELVGLLEQHANEAAEETLEGLLQWEDQETDIDNRPVGKPYHVICGNCRETIEYILARRKGVNNASS